MDGWMVGWMDSWMARWMVKQQSRDILPYHIVCL